MPVSKKLCGKIPEIQSFPADSRNIINRRITCQPINRHTDCEDTACSSLCMLMHTVDNAYECALMCVFPSTWQSARGQNGPKVWVAPPASLKQRNINNSTGTIDHHRLETCVYGHISALQHPSRSYTITLSLQSNKHPILRFEKQDFTNSCANLFLHHNPNHSLCDGCCHLQAPIVI